MRDERQQITIAQALLEASAILRRTGIAEARRDAGSLLLHALECDRAFLITHADDALAPETCARYQALIARRAQGEPLQYITGRQEFYGLDFLVTPDVLIPRPETELLVEAALKLLPETPAPFICDVGTGSGCIPGALLTERAAARAVALDISLAALRVAALNAAQIGVSARLRLVVSDCFAALNPLAARFDMIVSNPPYVAERDMTGLQREVRDYEPRLALTPGGDGLQVIRRLISEAPQFLAPGGHLLIEIGYDQHEAVRSLIDPRVWTLLDIHQDLQGIPRTVALRLAA